MKTLIVSLTLLLSSCTMMVIPGAPRGEFSYTPDKEILRNHPIKYPVIGSRSISNDPGCEPYVMLEREPYQPLEETLGDLEELDQNHDLLIDKLFRHIRLLEKHMVEENQRRKDRYHEYLKRCLMTQ